MMMRLEGPSRTSAYLGAGPLISPRGFYLVRVFGYFNNAPEEVSQTDPRMNAERM